MAWYRSGTISLTNGSAAVTGTGTAWILNASVGEALLAPDGKLYEISAITSDTSITLATAYMGATQAGQAYVLVPTQSYIRDLAAQAAALVNTYSSIANNAGAGKFGDGTVAAPGVTFAGDQDTGFFRSGNNEVTFVANGVAQFKYSATGGVQFLSTSVDINGGTIDGTVVGGAAPAAGNFTSLSASVLAVAGAITTNGLKEDAAGNIGLGTPTPHYRLDVRSPSTLSASFEGASTAPLSATAFWNNQVAGVDMWDTAASLSGAGVGIRFRPRNAGINNVAGIAAVSPTSGIADLVFHVQDAAGSVPERLRVSSGAVRPGVDNAQSLGEASFRWSVVFAGTGTINTSDAREKTAVSQFSEAELNAAKQLSKEIGIYKFLDSVAAKGDGARKHVGLTVQRAIEIMEGNGLDPFSYGFICYDEWDQQVIEHPAVEAVEAQDAWVGTIEHEAELDEEGNTVVEARTETIEHPAIEAVEAKESWTEVTREAGNRYGFRYDQLNMFIARGIEARLAALEAA